jgi:hypothetical protein
MDFRNPNDRGIDPRDVRSRDDLVHYLSQSLTGEYRTVIGEDEIRSTSTLVKSYLIEMHRESVDPARGWLTQGFPEVTQLADRTLLRVFDRRGAVYFVDARNPRFQIVHTIDRVDQTDATMEKLTGSDSMGFDHAWMPANFLKAQNRGRLTGFAFRFEDAMPGILSNVIKIDYETGEIHTDHTPRSRTALKVSEDAKAEVEYQNLLDSDAFRGRKPLEQIEFHAVDADQSSEYTISSIYSWGKIVTRGNWIGGHLATVDKLTENYERVISRIEDQYALGWVPQGQGYVHRGRPFEFRFPEGVEIDDLGGFAGTLFRTTKPFRLFGITHRRTDRRIDVAAVDLHSGDPISFEITPLWIRAYLPIGSCGNIIPRLYANLQKSVNSEIALDVEATDDPFTVEEQWLQRV